MPRKFAFVVTDLKTFHHLELHVVTLPTVYEKDFYRQVSSFNSFFYSIKWRRNVIKGVKQYYAKHWDEFVEENERLIKRFPTLDDTKLPTFEHASIWDFYKAIGYDYKSKKYVLGSPRKLEE